MYFVVGPDGKGATCRLNSVVCMTWIEYAMYGIKDVTRAHALGNQHPNSLKLAIKNKLYGRLLHPKVIIQRHLPTGCQRRSVRQPSHRQWGPSPGCISPVPADMRYSAASDMELWVIEMPVKLQGNFRMRKTRRSNKLKREGYTRRRRRIFPIRG